MTDKQQGARVRMLPFPRTRWAIIGFVAGVFTWSFAGGGRQHRIDDDGKSPGTDTGGAVGAFDSTLSRLSQGIQDTTSSVRGRISDVQNSAQNMNLSASVKDRLSREKSIDDDRIEVEIKDKGTVVLKGQVPDASAKETAVNVARDTEGVLRVEDRLSIPPATRVFASTADESPATTRSKRTR
jgi:hypothetical protein